MEKEFKTITIKNYILLAIIRVTIKIKYWLVDVYDLVRTTSKTEMRRIFRDLTTIKVILKCVPKDTHKSSI